MLQNDKDVIVAVATAPGRGGVGIVRLSGAIDLQPYVLGLLGREALEPRLASYCRFQDCAGESIDEGVALFFPNPSSFTGENVLELQGHGGPVVLDRLVQRCVELGARLAVPASLVNVLFSTTKWIWLRLKP